MNVRELEKLKRRVDEYGRLDLARRIKMPYGTLSRKLSGFAGMKVSEAVRIEACLQHGTPVAAPQNGGDHVNA